MFSYDLAKRLSEALKLDEYQCLELVATVAYDHVGVCDRLKRHGVIAIDDESIKDSVYGMIL